MADMMWDFCNKCCGDSENVCTHFEELSQLWEQLAAMGKDINNEDYADVLMSSLPPSYDTACVTAWLACMPENCRDMWGHLMTRSGRLPEGRLEGVSPRIEAGEPLEDRWGSNNKVSMSHGCSGQDSDYLACWPIPAQSMQCKRRASAQEAAQQSLDASVSMMIMHD